MSSFEQRLERARTSSFVEERLERAQTIAGAGRMGLTPREYEIVKLIAEGLTNAEIATKLWITPETVKTHLKHINVKMGARSRAHVVSIALRKGMID